MPRPVVDWCCVSCRESCSPLGPVLVLFVLGSACSLSMLRDLGNRARSMCSFAAVIGAMGMYLTSRAYADLKLSLSAASCAHLSVLGGLSRKDFADLLVISFDSLWSSSIWPDRKSLSRRVMHFLRLVPLCPGLGGSGFGHSMSCSNMNGKIQIGSGLYSSVPASASPSG